MKRLAKASMILAATIVLFSSCSAYNKMQANVGEITANATPEVVTLKGDMATADVVVTFPPKYFYEDMVLKLTPVLMFEGGEIVGTPKYVMGQDVKENYPSISWKHGGHYRTTVEIPYDPRASLSLLEIRIEGRSADNCKSERKTTFAPFGAIAVAPGVSIIGDMAFPELYPVPHGYQRVNTITKQAELYYNVGSADVRLREMSKEQIKELEAFVKEHSGKPNVKLSAVHTKGYASPEGPVTLNNNLSNRRAVNGESAIKKELKDIQLNYDNKGYGEDWAGFEKLLRESNITDKDFVLQLIAMYPDVNVREREIKNLGYIWNDIRKEILPPLRRAQFSVTAEITGRTDAEIMTMARRGDKNLSKTEYLYAAEMARDNNEKIAILRAAANQYDCCMPATNLAVALAEAGDYDGAMVYAKKAAAKHPTSERFNANVAAIAILQGDHATAREYLEKVDAKEYAGHHGMIFMKEGNYNMASKTLTGYNLAVLETAQGNFDAAKRALTGIDCANADYLRAVISMKEGKTSEAVSNLRNSIRKDPSMKAKAEYDVEFAKIHSLPEFMNL